MANMNEFMNLPTTSITDALGSKNYMDMSIKPLKEDWHLAGPAYPVQISAGENISVLEAIYHAKPGDVLVINGEGGTKNAFAGDFIIGLAKSRGLNGVVADGVIRDIIGIKELDLPVFCLGTTTAASKKNKIGEINRPIVCGGVQVNPGDIVVGDADGVVVIPKGQQEEILNRTKQRIKDDEEREKKVGTEKESVEAYLKKVIELHREKG
ncbi:regulator [Alkalihalobacillus alcalophilus ATCC 27647 = CGMCC 1.3604]|uniref:Putative 4-hydroxy-4-methyl-2-oxoglutarate aldolase n=1 Tax=Alkalihalobacillus alcalophilus ATCC 27647 = CGMCC 1.3604 TaxID=1218173 RepID=A0A094XGI1_ALKAL|nr:RraA family protein [Alkalihalobacillus alcalophilus]KGA97865.1 regulator [Alkalihalobacillus alcalophilus ATCC 27647 = CGMCC 1.3604]MED1562110.1 RraA family protein [Alkalihalobacillus alcalophilus]THG88913.1 regulator [Alkalihalobacillus alcalophilus ATCC 27647 = CGMCC 1.3604]